MGSSFGQITLYGSKVQKARLFGRAERRILLIFFEKQVGVWSEIIVQWTRK